MSTRKLKTSPLWALALIAALGMGVSACVHDGGGDDTATDVTDTEPMEPEPSPGEQQMTLITNASQGLATALMGLDTDSPTVMQIAAVDSAIALLQNALAGAVDLSPNDTATARGQLDMARTTVATARKTLSDAEALATRQKEQTEAITTAQSALTTALDALMADDAASITAVNAAITALKAAVDAAADLSDAEKMSANSALMAAEVSAANAELDMYTAATMAEGATDEEKLAAYQGKLKAAQRLKAAEGASAADLEKANMVIGAANVAIAQLQRDIKAAAEAAANKVRLAKNKVSMQVETALKVHKPGGEPPQEFLIDADADNDPDLAISRTSGAAKITLGQTAAEKRAKPYTQSTAPSVVGFMGTQFSNTDDSGKRPVTEMAAVYTDIEEAKDQAWIAALDAASTNTPNPTTGAIDVSGLSADRLGSGILGVRVVAGTTKAGTLYGVTGAFSCSAGGCVATKTADGTITVDGGDLTFTPTIPTGKTIADVMAEYADPDLDYTYFGHWMRSATQRDGTLEHDIETFFGGSGTPATNLGTVVGTATYYGGASGVYVKNDGAGDSLVVTDGTFTAEAMLTADFGGSDIAASKMFMISGTISDFMDGTTDLGFAELTLNPADFGHGDPYDAASTTVVATFSGETDGGGTSGNWRGQFYGNAGADTAETGEDDDDYPLNVSGEFNGYFVDGIVAGAFGAEYDE